MAIGTTRSRASTRSKVTPYEELGTTGLRHYGGFVQEEWLAKLSGKRGAWLFREMADNDPVIGAVLFAIEMLARGVEQRVEPGADPRATELVETSMDDMSGTWPDFIAEAFSKLTYGWAYHEIVYKRRLGSDPKGDLPASRYEDGLIGWRKMPVRAQETLESWEFAEDGGLNAMVQVAYDGARRTIPVEKAVLFRTTTKRANPEGRSILRNAFVPWFRKKNIEETEAIGLDRDLTGIPMVTGPEGTDLYADGNETLLALAQDLVMSVRMDEHEGIVKNHGWEFELVTTGGTRQDTDSVIRRYDSRITTVVLADFILMAQDKVGSYGLGARKIETFGQAMQAWLMSDAEVLNRYAIPRLLRLNGMSVKDPPRIVPGQVDKRDLSTVMEFLEGLHRAGYTPDWNHELVTALFKEADLPEPEEVTNEPGARGDDPAGNAYDEPTEDEAEIEQDPLEDDTVPAPGGAAGKPAPELVAKPKPKARA